MSSTASAMSTAVSGLRAQSRALNTISGNVNNSQTHSYKVRDPFFHSLVTNKNGGGGVTYGAKAVMETVGLPEETGVSTHMMLESQGFFVARQGQGGGNIYTRAGDFDFDVNKNLVNGAGHFLQGWRLDPRGNPINATGGPANINGLGDLETIKEDLIVGPPKATTRMGLYANLPAQIEGLNGQTEQRIPVYIYDSLGGEHEITFSWQKTANEPLTWTLAIEGENATIQKDNDGGVLVGRPFDEDVTEPITVVFDAHGQPLSFDGADAPPPLFISWDGIAAENQNIDLDLQGMSSQAGIFQRHPPTQDGYPSGQKTHWGITNDGILEAFFDNGQKMGVWKIPIAHFTNASGLLPVEGTAYQASAESGLPYWGGEAGATTRVVAGALESSDVDLAKEFTRMISTQHAYSAAAGVITTADQMYTTLSRIRG